MLSLCKVLHMNLSGLVNSCTTSKNSPFRETWVCFFPKYGINDNRYGLSAESELQRHHTFHPHLFGLFGRYCLAPSLDFIEITDSSIQMLWPNTQYLGKSICNCSTTGLTLNNLSYPGLSLGISLVLSETQK